MAGTFVVGVMFCTKPKTPYPKNPNYKRVPSGILVQAPASPNVLAALFNCTRYPNTFVPK